MSEKTRGAKSPTILRLLLTTAAVLLVAALFMAPVMAADYITENAGERTLLGSGTADDPYRIYTADDLDKIRYYVVNTGVEDITTGTNTKINSQKIVGHFKLMNNIDMSSFGAWIPIGVTVENASVRYKTAFTGTFDGNEKTISNLVLKIAFDETQFGGVGLFTRLGENAVVKDLTIDTCTTENSATITKEFGALCGTAWGSTIENVAVKKATLSGGEYAGGISGDIGESGETGMTVTGCTVEESTISGGAATGGMFGRTHSKDVLTDCTVSDTTVTANDHSVAGFVGILAGTVSNCHATGVTVTSTHSGTAYAGGLAGNLQPSSTVDGCTASGTVDAGTDGQKAGGLAAYTTSTSIKNSHAEVEVTGKQSVGGLVGYISASTVFENCYATGSVTITGSVTDEHYAGGLIGRANENSFTNCYATGTVTDSSETTVSSGAIGGLIGSAASSCTLTNCHATGKVTANADYAGGLVGHGKSTTITDCYATGDVTGKTKTGGLIGEFGGTVTNSYATGDVSGTMYAGGFVGMLNAGSTITNCATSGAVTATDAESGQAGGFVAHFDGKSAVSNAIATGTVSGTTAGAFVGFAASEFDGMTNCYANSTSSVPFTGSYTNYYSPQNCFWTGGVTGMLSSGEPKGSDDGVKDYYYAKMTFSDADIFVDEELTIVEQQDTVGTDATGTPKHTLTVKSNPENLVSVDADKKITAENAGSGTISLVLTVNGRDFAFGTVKADVKAAVDFKANGGAGSMAQQIFTGSEEALDKNQFTRAGHDFSGWNTKEDGTGTAYTDEQNVQFTKNITLYAQWIHDDSSISPNMPTVNIDEATGETTITTTGTVTITVSTSDKTIATINDPESGTTITVAFATAQPTSGSVSTVSGKVVSIQVDYPESKMTTENGGEAVYIVGIEMKNLTESLPMLNPAFTSNIADLVKAQGEDGDYNPLAMVSASGELIKINGNITEITFTFKIPKTGNSLSKVKAFHIWTDADGKQQIEPAEAVLDSKTDTTYYLITVTGSKFSTYVIAQDNTVDTGSEIPPGGDPVTPGDQGTPGNNGGSTGYTGGSSVWLTENPAPTEPVQPSEPEQVPTDVPTTQPTTEPESPGFGVLAVLGGLGAVAVLRRK